jgi:hypothetical protein
VALDGTKVKANASKHKAMSDARMQDTEQRLAQEVQVLLTQVAAVDAREDTTYGHARRGDELPAELARRESRLAKIREAKAALEQEAKERAAAAGKLAARAAAGPAQGTTRQSAGSGASRTGAEGAAQFHGSRVAHHDRRRDEELRAGLQRPGCRG